MKVFMIGGTGLLGSAAAQLFIDKGHQVKSVALPPLPVGAPIPEEMELEFGNFLELSDDELKAMMTGCDCFVFAAGVDERVEFPPPVYDSYKKYNNDPVERMIKLAKECGVKKSIILGSYFVYFAREFPEMELAKKHPYIRSRVDQEDIALSLADENMDVAVLELPYIFGVQPGRKPVWVVLIEQLANMGKITMYPKGGTTMLTVRQVAQTIVGAAEKNKGANAYPIGYYNLSWDDFLTVVHAAMGEPNRKIIHVAKWMFKLYSKKLAKDFKERNADPGIDLVGLADIMYMNTFIDKKWSVELGATHDDIKSAIFDSVKLSVDAYKGTQELVDMKGE
ncbi:MAG TPA: NAD-dependent epimerase/dehydratase family protein [Clostridia bacterium]|nr:NAD-dependent epimerase/dehydratase family protein [Clostridia bacterium]